MSEYRVLARKYRPDTFADMVGQDVLVRTLTNAITSGRIAHAFLLTGIRGVGKTTTARIIARALNCIGADGQGGPTPEPCGVCSNCQQIREDRHVDVIEMDAASRTGVNDIRELIETVHYKPAQARYKIYIIDEVHMLSTSAFNALLKTLEEPPPHVIFVFATTEIHKIPVTILSRCQRFDLRRLDTETLTAHLTNIATKEQVSAQTEALALIAMAAEGSVRDALSLFDQAIAHSASGGEAIAVSAETVRGMLGLSDRSRSFALLEALLSGNTQAALASLEAQYRDGADMLLLFQDLLQRVHMLTRLRLDAAADIGPVYTPEETARARELAAKLSMPALTRAWQMLTKGIQEIKYAADTRMSAEMLCVRIAYAASLPTPAEVIATLKEGGTLAAAPAPRPATAAPSSGARSSAAPTYSRAPQGTTMTAAARQSEPATVPEPVMAAPQHLSLAASNPPVALGSFEALASWLEKQREPLLYHHLIQNARLVSFEAGLVVFARDSGLPNDFTAKLAATLQRATDQPWRVLLADEPGAPTIAERRKMHQEQLTAEALAHTDVQAVFTAFPGAKILEVKEE